MAQYQRTKMFCLYSGWLEWINACGKLLVLHNTVRANIDPDTSEVSRGAQEHVTRQFIMPPKPLGEDQPATYDAYVWNYYFATENEQ